MSYYSRIRYVGDGTTDSFVVPFPYLSAIHLHVYLNGVETSAYTWLNQSTIKFNTPPANDAAIFITRVTPRDEREVNFENTTALSESVLDLDSNQLFYALQESLDDGQDAVKIDSTNSGFNADGSPIINLSDPTSAQDAATKAYVDGLFETSGDAILQPYVTSAATSETNATDAYLNARDQKILAWRFAQMAEDTEIPNEYGYSDGGYSAFHWAQKAQEIADGINAGGSSGYDLDVKLDYLASGNGVTDDTTAVSNALNAASNKTLYFPAGTYRIGNANGITLSAIENAKIIFHPNAKLLFDALAGTAAGINVTPSPTTNAKTVSITVNAGASTLTINSATGVSVGDYLEIDTQGTGGLYRILGIATNTLTLDRRIFKSITNGTVVYHLPATSIAKNLEFYNLNCDYVKTGTGNTAAALIKFFYTDGVLLSGTTLANSEIPSSLINLYYCKKIKIENLVVNIPGTVDANSTSIVLSATRSNDVKIDWISCTNVVDGVSFTDCSDFKISGGVFHGQTSSTNDGSTNGMIFLSNCTRGIVENCMIDYHYRTGIRLATCYSGIIIKNNVIENIGYDPGYEEAIDVVGSNANGEGVIIDGNQILNCNVQVGIRVSSGVGTRVINNSISGLTGTVAINAGGSTYTLCAGNMYDNGDTVSNGNTGSVSSNNIAMP